MSDEIAVQRPEKPSFVDCDEESLEFSWKLNPQSSYLTEYREYGSKSWKEDTLVAPIRQHAGAVAETPSHRLSGLNPKSTYEVRVVAIRNGARSDPSEILTIDTQARLSWFDRIFFHKCSQVCRV